MTHEALRLADALETQGRPGGMCQEAAAMLRRVPELERDAERYRKFQRELYANDVIVGREAYVSLKVVGACPNRDEFDAHIDAMKGSA